MHRRAPDRLRVAFIDWSGTLSDSALWSGWQVSAPDEWRLVQNEIFGNMDLVRDWMRGTLCAAEVIAPLVERSRFGIADWIAELERSCGDMRLKDPSIRSTVTLLRATGMKVVIATDNMDVFTRWTVPALGLADLVDDILNSSAIGCLKDDRDAEGRSPFFDPWLEQQGIDRGEAVLFDDGGRRSAEIGIRWVPVSTRDPLNGSLCRLLAAAQLPGGPRISIP